jgi:hypothetical protein
MTDFDKRLNVAWSALKIALGVGLVVAGIDKNFNKLTDWSMYLSPLATRVIPVSPATFSMRSASLKSSPGSLCSAAQPGLAVTS